MMIPSAIRKRNLEEMLREKRKEHILKLHDMQKQMNTSCQFSEEDALSFLKGDIQPGYRVNLSDNAQTAIRVLCPFNLYKNLKDENFLERIRSIHHERKTFEITPNNVHLFNAALQNQHKIQRNHAGEKIILRRSASINIRAYEEHDSILRARLSDAIADHQKEKKIYGNGLRS